MDPITVAERLCMYYGGSRAVGHTTAALKGVYNSDRDAMYGVVIRAQGRRMASQMSKDRIVTALDVEKGRIYGHRRPLVLDHEFIRVLLSGLLEEIGLRDKEIADLREGCQENDKESDPDR